MAEWDNEPDEDDFLDEATGLACAMRRGPLESWCAYVGIPVGHPLHGKSYRDPVAVPDGYMDRKVTAGEDFGFVALFIASMEPGGEWPMELAVRCHGGLTYSGDRVPRGQPDGKWWVGFDCSHAGDLSPKLRLSDGDVYRNEAYVRASLVKLCSDIAALGTVKTEA